MLVIFIFGILASLSFRRILREKGYVDSKVWFFPILSGSLIMLVAYGMTYFSGFWIQNPEAGFARGYPFLVGFLALLVHALVVSKVWKQIRALPDSGADQEEFSGE